MRTTSRGLSRSARPGLLAVAVLALALSACGEPAAPVPSAPPTSTPRQLTLPSGSAGSDGLTVRYLDHDGTVKTVRVEDFRR